MLGWLLVAAFVVAGLTAIIVGVVGQIARTRAVMTGGFWYRGKHYSIVEDADDHEPGTDFIDEVGPLIFSPELDGEHRGNIDRWR